jgi:hypothetical protein
MVKRKRTKAKTEDVASQEIRPESLQRQAPFIVKDWIGDALAMADGEFDPAMLVLGERNRADNPVRQIDPRLTDVLNKITSPIDFGAIEMEGRPDVYIPLSRCVSQKLSTLHVGILVGAIAYRQYRVGMSVKEFDAATGNLLKVVSNIQGAAAELDKSVQRSAITRGELSQAQNDRIDVATFLGPRYPTVAINSNNLYLLPDKIKEEGRQYLRQVYGNSLGIRNRIKEVFRKPRKSTDQSGESPYKINK